MLLFAEFPFPAGPEGPDRPFEGTNTAPSPKAGRRIWKIPCHREDEQDLLRFSGWFWALYLSLGVEGIYLLSARCGCGPTFLNHGPTPTPNAPKLYATPTTHAPSHNKKRKKKEGKPEGSISLFNYVIQPNFSFHNPSPRISMRVTLVISLHSLIWSSTCANNNASLNMGKSSIISPDFNNQVESF